MLFLSYCLIFINTKKNKSKIILSGLLIDDELDLNKLLNQLQFKVIDKLKMGEWICLIIE